MTSPALFEVVHLTAGQKVEDLPAPEHGPYFVLAKDGLFVMKQAHWGRTLVPAPEVPTLEKGEPLYWRDIPAMPMSILGQAWSFFRAIWNTKHSEAMVDITWSEEKGYRLFVPPQTATSGGVNATRNAAHYRDQIVGTIHSHPWSTPGRTAAFHSGTDRHDADEQDGLHITMGDVNEDNPSLAIMVSSSKVKWDLQVEHVLSEPLALVPHPTWWERYVSDPPRNVVSQYRGNGGAHHSQGSMIWSGARPQTNTKPNGNTTPRRVFISLASLLRAYQVNDPTIIAICDDIEKQLDNAQWLLDQMGIDLDFSIEKQIHRAIGTTQALNLLFDDEDEPRPLELPYADDSTMRFYE